MTHRLILLVVALFLFVACAGSGGEVDPTSLPSPTSSSPAPSPAPSAAPRGEVGAPCKDDTECLPHLICDPSLTELGTPLRCQPRVCYAQAHCPPEHDCVNGVCQPTPPCSGPGTCPEGLVCLNGAACVKLGECP
jgi:hypothetical protein